MNLDSLAAVAESRRLLLALLTRRSFLGVAGSIAGLALTGCGSSDSTGPTGTTPPVVPPPVPPGQVIPEGLSTVQGTISLPAGSALKMADLRVDVGCQVIPVSPVGAFIAGVSPNGPSLALLTDATDNGVLMSMFSAGSVQTISARTTAVTLFYYATSAYTLPASVMPQVLSLIDSDPAMAALEDVVARAVAADPHAIVNNAAPLGPAIIAALTTMLGTAPALAAPSPSYSPVDAAANAPGHAGALLNAHAVGVPTLMTVEPSPEQNGVMVVEEDGTTALLVSNSKRRGCKVYVYQVETLVDGKTESKVPPVRETGPIDLDSTVGISIINVLKELTTWFYGHTIFQPVKLPAIPLILKPTNADKTIYKVVVIASTWGALSDDALEPAFFHDAYWSQELSGWRADVRDLFLDTVIGDLLLPTLCFTLGVGAIVASKEVVKGVIKQAAATGGATFTRLLTNLKVGGLGQVPAALQTIVTEAFSSTLSTQFYKPAVQAIVGKAQAKALQAESQVLTASRALKGANMFQKVFAPVFAAGSALQAWDFGAVVYDTFTSDIASMWTATLVRQKIGLEPVDPRVASGDIVNFTVDLPANVTGTYTYEWTQTSLFATFSVVGESNFGSSVTTTKRAVNLATSGSDAGPISVLVVGYDTRTQPRTEIGRAGTTVNFLYPAEILPSAAILQVKQVQPFSVLITGELPTDIVYNWTVIGQAGTLGGQAARTTNTPQVTFNAGDVPGVCTLRVDAVNSAGMRWASTTVPIGVEFPAEIQPANVTLNFGQQQVYSVVVSGQLPAGILYKWTVVGQAGTLNGQTTLTTDVPQVAFHAGNEQGVGTLRVDVVTAAGVRWAHADVQMIVARAPSISFTLAGPWDAEKQPPNGTYNFASLYDGRVPLEDEPGLDQIGFVYNVGHDNSIGVFVAIHLATGRVIKTGDTFIKYSNTANGDNTNGTFQFLLSNNLIDADAPGARQSVPEGPGTLKFDSVSRTADGTWVLSYSFSITSAAGATVVAVGAARWK